MLIYGQAKVILGHTYVAFLSMCICIYLLVTKIGYVTSTCFPEYLMAIYTLLFTYNFLITTCIASIIIDIYVFYCLDMHIQ